MVKYDNGGWSVSIGIIHDITDPKIAAEQTKKDPNKEWLGPCGDSFCYASCDSPHCHFLLRRAPTPEEHYNVIAREEILKKEEARIICHGEFGKD